MLQVNQIYNIDCLEGLKQIDNKSIQLILTDIPYGEVNRKSNGLRNLDKGMADVLMFNLDEFLAEVNRVCKGSVYIFCGTEQVSKIRATFVDFGLSTRHCCWEKCLAGSTAVYLKSQNNEYYTATLKDIARNNFPHACLWDGEKWNKIVNIVKNQNVEQYLKIELRSGEKIKCTTNHRFVLSNGTILTSHELEVGYILKNCILPGKKWKSHLNKNHSSHYSAKSSCEIISIEMKNVTDHPNETDFWDVQLESEPHVFALASGVLTHNSNPSPMNGQYIWLSSIENCIFAKNPKATFNEHCKSAVWRFPNGRSKIHPTEKPLKLFEYLIQTSSNEGDLILDPCLGSGTTALACKQLNRNFIGFEIDKGFFDIANKRINNA